MKKIFLFMCAIMMSISLMAQTEDKPWSIGIYGSKVEGANDWGNKLCHPADNFYGAGSITLSHYLNAHFDATIHALWGCYGTQGGELYPNDGEFKAGIRHIDVTGKFKFIKKEETLLHPFIFAGVGVRSVYGLDESDEYQTTNSENEGIAPVISYGLGCDFRLSEAWGIRYFASVGFALGDNADKADNRVMGDYNDKQMFHSLGVFYNFAFNTDKDGDGVANKLDKCPKTPVEARGHVDANGCPLDSDKDGVPDYLDKCPDTDSQAKVDSLGCPIDTDKDGVADYLDKCPETPENVTVDADGCPLDSDKDGVADYLDKCPGTPAEAKGFIDENGCPTDKDNDGVLDYEDVCPDQFGVKENKGCPEIKEEVKQVFEKALNGIEFQSGSAKIKSVSNDILDQVVSIMKENPTYKLSIAGHTDNVGKAEKNLKLSEDRAAAVKDYIVAKGIEADRLTSAGFGQQNPVASNKTAAGKAKNRRVEFKVIFEK